ncbi:MAG: N-acetyltransferase [Deinococcota bacterium]|jgi:GNAT superfamily N-acetyltransferase|nr:N-acetyltransferase [Deinococcota bacterium]
MTTTQPVTGRADLKTFIHYPFALYKNDPHWVPPLLIAEWERFDPKKNPFFDHAEVALFVARRSGRVVGRVAAIDDERHNLAHGDNLVFFGFFEAEDEAAADALLSEVETWARARGRQAVRGPVNLSMNDGSGFQIDAYGTDPFVMMPYNPPSYPGYAETLGYGKVKDLYAYWFTAEQGMGERIARIVDRVAARNKAVVRPANMKNYRSELEHVKHIYNDAWEKNWGFVKMTDREFEHFAKELKMIIDPRIALFIEIGGVTAGFCMCIPNIHQVFKRMNGRLLPFGLVHLLRRRSIVDEARLAILGLLPEFRNRGLELLLINEIYQRGRAAGYKRGELSWVLEDNEAMNKGIEASGAILYKTYRLYQKALS